METVSTYLYVCNVRVAGRGGDGDERARVVRLYSATLMPMDEVISRFCVIHNITPLQFRSVDCVELNSSGEVVNR